MSGTAPLKEFLVLEGILPSEILLDDPDTTMQTIERGGKVAGFFSYRGSVRGWTVLDHFVVARWARNTSVGARLWHQMRRHFRDAKISRVILSVKMRNPKLSLFLQHVLHATPYRIDGGCVDMILEV